MIDALLFTMTATVVSGCMFVAAMAAYSTWQADRESRHLPQ
jgi:cytochrome bd-type quinol oxidase subunit 1